MYSGNGSYNTAVGYTALNGNTGSSNTVVGYGALIAGSGGNSVAIGRGALGGPSLSAAGLVAVG